MTYQQLLTISQKKLSENNIHDGFAFRLMLEMCELKGINLYMDKDTEMSQSFATEYANNIDRLLLNEPMAYVLGFEWFFGRRFITDSSVLIPREETEELVGHVLADIDEYFSDSCVIFDVATGSGNLGITLKLELPNSTVLCSDISVDAIETAKKNASNLEADVNFLVGDMAQPFIERNIKCNVLVCNPPYILFSEEVQTSVLEYEPHVALFGGEDGLDFYRQLLDEAPRILNEKSMIAFEMGFNQRENLTVEIEKRFPEATIRFEKDLNGLDRMCFVYFNCN